MLRNYEIQSISGHQTAKVIATVLASISLIFVSFSLLMVLFTSPIHGMTGRFAIMLITIPIMHFIIAYLIIRLFCFVYNVLSPKFGGIGINLEDRL